MSARRKSFAHQTLYLVNGVVFCSQHFLTILFLAYQIWEECYLSGIGDFFNMENKSIIIVPGTPTLLHLNIVTREQDPLFGSWGPPLCSINCVFEDEATTFMSLLLLSCHLCLGRPCGCLP